MFISKNGKPNYQNATHNIVFDGNSLVAGQGATVQYLANKVHSLPVLASSGLTVKSFGIGSQQISSMTGGIADVNGAYESGKRNILIAWEITNSVYFGKNAVQVAEDFTAYCNAANAGFEIYAVLTIPRRQSRQNGDSSDIYNAVLEECNAEIKKNWKDIGLAGYIDLRLDGSPFKFSGYTTTDFATADAYWAAGEKSTNGISVHLNSAGYDIVAQYIAQKLRSIGVR